MWGGCTFPAKRVKVAKTGRNYKVLPRKDVLTGKDEGFCRAYVRLGNGAQAYREHHPDASDATAYVQASRLLDKPKITLRIEELRANAALRSEITIGRVLTEYGKLAFVDVRKAFNADGTMKPIHELDDSTAAAISGIEFDGANVAKIKIGDKRAALDSIAKHLGMFVDRTDHRFVDKDGKDRNLLISDLDAIVNEPEDAE